MVFLCALIANLYKNTIDKLGIEYIRLYIYKFLCSKYKIDTIGLKRNILQYEKYKCVRMN